ncbi:MULTISPECIES: type I restriction endonuclease subunit R [Methanohalophilus]|jgi:type I restriction enzyme R subunit|uniref:DEAD/DEAH box helicase n=1 Tax=Methanohalophilus euhalobius TaxID=51203 RepID=A0A285ENF2_9EURY|nr:MULTISPECIES: DEAD/DEAH box helicase family protein [Methanohalophilus]KXS46775.1 MAG: type I restriction enzyme, R subunit [Methanohalophilus sp. T328-1]OBZ36027.1 MAG: restriction endonuclease subunit R [Methanohalophilus sp. DAL1]ODV49191.1 MAG: type I restriction enzyme, R subunit [Methanohalophilus sp. 2-GBenrich]PQV43509.1 type I restriction enzyme R subunit [Methanohalophilus euhalobius]RNI07339.1 DEAD/DEAH box helicase [Methanohalophilus euhalobius]
MSHNQKPEQVARDLIDKKLNDSGWAVQAKNQLDWNASTGVAIKEYQTEVGPADYVLFVDQKPVGVIEAKKEEEGHHLTVVEEQSAEYATSKLKYLNNEPLPFVYESTGKVTRYTDYRDPKPRSRPAFSFHRPETFLHYLKQEKSLKERLLEMPDFKTDGLRDCQIRAIYNLEESFKKNRPRALVQMATGSGKTYTAITFIYRLLKFADAKKILFLVDTRNLGEQAEQEFMAYVPNDDNRKFTELYNVQRLTSNYISSDSQVCISTIQRLYSILKDEELDEESEEENPAEKEWKSKEPLPVVYNENVPIEEFDFVVIDECHRSIYNLWQQVLDYFDAFLIGLTATPDKRTFAFFNENVVSEYSHEEAVADGVNVGYEVYTIETEITKNGAEIKAEEFVDKREKLSRKKRWEQLDEDFTYTSNKLDRDVVNPSQIRNVIRTFKNKLPEIFPGRKEVPKTLIFAKTDSHADDIIQVVREEFGEGNAFCKKVTYKVDEDPKSVLSQFRNDYNPRIAVTVDMIATGTDVKPLECLMFMRDVKSRNYFEQMKGRGTRTLDFDDLQKVTPSSISAKTHFVIVDAVGVTRSMKTDSRSLERKKGTPMKDLLGAVTFGAEDEDVYVSLANRLARLEKQITPQERETFAEKTGGKEINEAIKDLLNAHNPDVIEAKTQTIQTEEPEISEDEARKKARGNLFSTARATFTGQLNEYLENVRKVHEQIIDTVNTDTVLRAEWDEDAVIRADEVVSDFKAYLEANREEITALQIFYNQPYQRRDVTFRMIKEVLEKLKAEKPYLAPLRVWQAYEQLEEVNGNSPKNELTALISLIRRVTEIDPVLTSYDLTVSRNFQNWVFDKQAGTLKFNEDQMGWLRMIRDYVATSFHLEIDDLDYAPFDALGGRGRMYQLFGNEMNTMIDELNEALAI